MVTQQPTQMPLVEHDEVVEAFPADGADDVLGERILPRRVGRDENLVNAHAVDSTVKGIAVDRVAVPEEIPWGRFVGECLNDLSVRQRPSRSASALGELEVPSALVMKKGSQIRD